MINEESLQKAHNNHQVSYKNGIESLNKASTLLLVYAIDKDKEGLNNLLISFKSSMPAIDGMEQAIKIGIEMGMPRQLQIEAYDIINYTKFIITTLDLLINYKNKRILKRLNEMKNLNDKGKPLKSMEVQEVIDKLLKDLIKLYERN